MLTNPVFSSLFGTSHLQQEKQKHIGSIYNAYRIMIGILFSINFLLTLKTPSEDLWHILNVLPSFGYLFISLILFIVYYFYPRNLLLVTGLVIDIVILSIALYFSGGSDLQIALMFLVVVAASYMLINTLQAVLLTLFAIVLVIYQQFFQTSIDDLNFKILSNVALMSVSFLTVAFLSWSISKRLNQIELLSERQIYEVNALNAINQQVVHIIQQGVLVITHQLELLIANDTAIQQLYLSENVENFDLTVIQPTLAENILPVIQQNNKEIVLRLHAPENAENPELVLYQYNDLRIRITQLGNDYALLLIEDLKREQTHAQQLKLAALGQLTASIAHEIRNPIATISQASQLLIEETQDPDSTLSADNVELYEMIFKQTKRVNQIIEDVLKLSRQAKPNQILIHPQTWIPEFIQENFASHDIFLHCHSSASIAFDKHQLEQVLTNLIKNGLRFCGKAHAHVFVTLKIHEFAEQLHIDVIDTGHGVSEEDLPNLFNPFFTTDHQGTGLGLYLSQSFCQANNANLHYITNHEHTCFRISCAKQIVEQ